MYEINLLPAELRRKTSIELKRLLMLLLCILLPAGLAGGYSFLLIEINHRHLEVNNIDRQLAQLKPQVNQTLQLRQERGQIEQQIPVLQSLLEHRFTITPILNDIADNLPVDLWITGLSVEYRANYLPRGGFASPGLLSPPADAPLKQEAGTGAGQQPEEQQALPLPNVLILQGISYSSASIGVLVGKLSALPYFQSVDLVKVHTADQGEQGLTFQIEAMLREVKQDAAKP